MVWPKGDLKRIKSDIGNSECKSTYDGHNLERNFLISGKLQIRFKKKDQYMYGAFPKQLHYIFKTFLASGYNQYTSFHL